MMRPALPLLLASALCLVLQGVALLKAGRGAEAPFLPWPYLFALFCLLGAALVLPMWRCRSQRRLGLVALLTGQLGLLVVAGVGLRSAATDPEQWPESRRQVLTAIAEREAALVAELPQWLDELGAAASTNAWNQRPFALADALGRRWRERHPSAARFPMALVIWQDGERLAWDDGAVPLPLVSGATPDSITWDVVQGGREGWWWRRFQRLTAGEGQTLILEMQLLLTGATLVGETTGRDLATTGAGGDIVTVITDVVRDTGPLRERWVGDAEHGLRLTRDLALVAPAEVPGEPRLRLGVASPPLRVQQFRQAARQLLLLLLLWSLALAGWAWSTCGTVGVLAGLWLARTLLVGVDYFRWIQPAFPGQQLPAFPEQVTSLIDPAYFATPFAGGWLASAADAILTALLLAGTAWLVVQKLAVSDRVSGAEATGRPTVARTAPAAPSSAVLPGAAVSGSGSLAARLGIALLFGLAVGLLLLGLRAVMMEVAANANARLIGPKVPVRFLSFWALHLLLLLLTGTACGLLTVLAGRGRRRSGHGRLTLVVAIAVAVLATVTPQVTLATRLALVVVALLLWWLAPVALTRGVPLRRLAFLVPLLLTVIWNYAVLMEAYEQAERAWLERKGDLIVADQEDWIQFLMEDVLSEMSATEPEPLARGEYLERAGGLWQNRAAYDLWRGSAVRDLGLPCLVEILDGDEYSVSLFTAGFLGDYSYEVRSRSAWLTSQPQGLADALPIATQREARRYTTGEERVLRGEVPRTSAPGWIRLELPVQSWRISTLISRLAGVPAEPAASGYRPRAEVDRPLLLLRGAASGWLDAGPSSFPDADAEMVIAALRQGSEDWGVVTVAGRRYRCLWRPLPAETAQVAGEGFLLGLQMPSLTDLLLDLSRLFLLDLMLLVVLVGLLVGWRLLRGRRPGLSLGFQERFLAGYLLLGLLLLMLAGMFVDRLSLERLAGEARQKTREGLTAGLAQLQGLLGEQARALAESEYIAGLLANRLAGQRPLGPFAVRQGMVFSGDGQLLLDETLSDLDAAEAGRLLTTARQAPLVVMDDGGELYLGIAVPIDLSGVLPDSLPAQPDSAFVAAGSESDLAHGLRQDGYFFYRQRVDADLLAGLAEIIQGEITLRIGGETVLASHPERVFSGLTPLMVPPAMMRPLLHHPVSSYLHPTPGTRLALTGCQALPVLLLDPYRPELRRLPVPAVLAVNFPVREREFAEQRERTILFLAGLASLILITAALLALLMTWNIFGPVRVLVTATRRLAGGDFSAPLPEGGRDEIGTLAASFRAMRSELQQAQATLAQRERFLTTVLNRVSVGVAVFATDWDVVALNPAGESILHDFFAAAAEMASAAAAVPDGNESAVTGLAAERARQLLARFRESVGPAEQGECELRSTDGRCTLRGRIAPLELPDGRRDTMIVFEDVTEFLNNKRLALNAELARQVAHEIKNPLTPIQLSVQQLRQAYEDRSSDLDNIVADTIRQVLEQVKLLRSIASEFSLLGRPEELTCVSVELPALVHEVVASYQARSESAAGVGPAVEVVASEVPPVLAHADSLVKVLRNLMENSLDASGEANALAVRVSWQVSEREVTLLWEDNGPGVSAEVADRLFDPYFSTKSRGTGLGLAICRNLLNKMGGRISLRNREDGGGAVAEIKLPRTPPGAGAVLPGGDAAGE